MNLPEINLTIKRIYTLIAYKEWACHDSGERINIYYLGESVNTQTDVTPIKATEEVKDV